MAEVTEVTEVTGSQRRSGGAETNGAPVGIFDSGLGGLSLLSELRRQLPHERVVYVADSAYAPYGSRPPSEIADRSVRIAQYLVGRGAKALLVACNTATAVAVRAVRQTVTVPVVAIEPAVKPAAESSRTKVIGVLATPATLASESFERLTGVAAGVRVIARPCEGLVEEIERGNLEGPDVRRILTQALEPIVAANADAVVLGCTHYPLVRAQIEQIVGPGVAVIDPAAAVIRQLHRRLTEGGLLSENVRPGTVEFLTTGDPERTGEILTMMLGEPTGASKVDNL